MYSVLITKSFVLIAHFTLISYADGNFKIRENDLPNGHIASTWVTGSCIISSHVPHEHVITNTPTPTSHLPRRSRCLCSPRRPLSRLAIWTAARERGARGLPIGNCEEAVRAALAGRQPAAAASGQGEGPRAKALGRGEKVDSARC